MPDVNDYKWELYNLTEDYSQANDLAAKMPDKLKEMQALFRGRGEEVQCVSARQFAIPARDHAAPEPHRGQDRLHLLG